MDWFVPVRVNRVEKEAIFQSHRVVWTPTVMIMDQDGVEHFRFTGFLPPEELCARIILDGAKAELNLKSLALSAKCLGEVVEKYPGTYAAPEALYYQAVVQFVESHDPKVLRSGLERLKQLFPLSEWTLRAKPYELIEV